MKISMNRIFAKPLFVAAFLLGGALAANATCSSLSTTNPNAYPVLWGWNNSVTAYQPLSLNSDCTSGGSGSGGGNVNLTGINGAAPSNANPLPVSADNEGTKASFLSSFTFTPPTSGIFVQYCGPTSGALRIRYISIQATTTVTSGYAVMSITKNSSAATGGTGTVATQVAMDTANTISNTSTLTYYTTGPTAGTSVGMIDSRVVPVTLNSAAPTPQLFSYGQSDTQSIVLRGAAQCIAMSLSSLTGSGDSFNVVVASTLE